MKKDFLFLGMIKLIIKRIQDTVIGDVECGLAIVLLDTLVVQEVIRIVEEEEEEDVEEEDTRTRVLDA